jgi:hypothetical protein
MVPGAVVLSVAVSASPVTLLAVASPVASNGTGTFAATPLSASSSWQVSAQTGDFTWSYPMAVPPAPAGPAPSLSLSYDSGSVDGETGSTNNQPSGVGDGWSVAGGGGFIERSYVPCALAGNPGSGDLCWNGDNATLSLGGHSGLLVKNSTTGYWYLQNDDGSRLQQLTLAANGSSGGQYWVLSTTDGTRYYFGETTNSA